MLLVLAFSLTACASQEINGIENFDIHDCSVELSYYLFPSEDFVTRFEYEDGDYWFYESDNWGWGYAKTFAYLRYSPNHYWEAKQYCMENFALSDVHQYEHNEYHFAEHICHTLKGADREYIPGSDYPRHFNMFAFNDQNHTLIFLGYYCGNPDNPERQLAEQDFSAFLKQVYSVYFDFDA